MQPRQAPARPHPLIRFAVALFLGGVVAFILWEVWLLWTTAQRGSAPWPIIILAVFGIPSVMGFVLLVGLGLVCLALCFVVAQLEIRAARSGRGTDDPTR